MIIPINKANKPARKNVQQQCAGTNNIKIGISDYLLNLQAVKSITTEICGDNFFSTQDNVDWYLSWAFKPKCSTKFGVTETGFFWNAMHIDTLGCYQLSSLNTKQGIKEIYDYQPTSDIVSLIKNSKIPNSKYLQPSNNIKWDGVIFASQNPYDRSITAVATAKDWWQFYEKCCKHYGKSLLVKLHPCALNWNEPNTEEKIRLIADKYKCGCAKFGNKHLSSCDHVVLFSSSFAVDCMLNGVRVKQGYPGYFYKTNAVTFCDNDLNKKLCNTINNGRQLANFLAWKYCFSFDINLKKWKELLLMYATSNKLFPLNEKFSFGFSIS